MRIHVERDIRRAREFHILNKTVPISHIDLASTEAHVAFFLGNLQAPLTGHDFFDNLTRCEYVSTLNFLSRLCLDSKQCVKC